VRSRGASPRAALIDTLRGLCKQVLRDIEVERSSWIVVGFVGPGSSILCKTKKMDARIE